MTRFARIYSPAVLATGLLVAVIGGTVQPIDGFSEIELLGLAAAVKKRSEHPRARAVMERAEQTGVPVSWASDFQSMTGAGAQAQVDGHTVIIASPSYFSKLGTTHADLDQTIPRLQAEGQTTVIVSVDGKPAGVISGLELLITPMVATPRGRQDGSSPGR